MVDSNCAACTNKAECGFCYVEFAANGTEGRGSCVAVREDDPEEPEYGRWVRRREGRGGTNSCRDGLNGGTRVL